MGLSTTYNGAFRGHNENFSSTHWQQLQIVTVAGRQLYRRTAPQPKCKRCRHMFGKWKTRLRGYKRKGLNSFAHAGQFTEPCNVCGNPFMEIGRPEKGRSVRAH